MPRVDFARFQTPRSCTQQHLTPEATLDFDNNLFRSYLDPQLSDVDRSDMTDLLKWVLHWVSAR